LLHGIVALGKQLTPSCSCTRSH